MSPLPRFSSRTLFLTVLVGNALLNIASGSFAQTTPRFSATGKDLYAASSEPVAPKDADVLVLNDDEEYRFDTQGRSVHTLYTVYKVLTQKGAEDWDGISLEWEPWHQQKPELRVRVVTGDGVVHELDSKTITDSASKEDDENTYSDRRVVRAPFPAIAPGVVVEEEVVWKESVTFFGAGSVSRIFIGRGVPVNHYKLVIEYPDSLPVRITPKLTEVKPQRIEKDGNVKLTFEAGPLQPFEEVEDYLPSDIPAFPHLMLSTGESWQAIAEQYAKIVDEKVKGSEVAALVSKVTAGKTIRAEKIEAVMQYLSVNVRYTGVEFGDAAIIPQLPGETLVRKYGDCKDKSTLLVAMLRAAGVDAHVAVLNVGNRMDVEPENPGMGLFDHAIVYVPGSPDFWIDATDEFARLGQLPGADQGRLALIAQPGKTGLVRTPIMSPQDNLLAETREFYLSENGPARVVETSYPHGTIESSYRSAYSDKDNKQTREKLTEYVKGQYLAEKLERLERSDPKNFSQPFRLTLEAKGAKRGFTDMESASVAIRFEGLFSRLPEELQRREKEDDEKTKDAEDEKPKKKRSADYQLPQAFVTEWQYRIVPPPGFQPKSLPPDKEIALGPAVLEQNFTQDKDNVVHARLRFDTVRRRLSVTEATELRNHIAELVAGEPIYISFQPAGQALLADGKIGEALQAYRDLIGEHPKEAVHHLQLAEALLTAGLGEAARREARLATNLEPTSALAQRKLAEILEYDLVGRKFRVGSDYAGAEVAFRAAEKLDPEDNEAPGNLGILLEHSPDGLRYGPGAKLPEAITEYRKLGPERLAKVGLANNLAFALFYNREFAMALKEAETLNPQPISLMIAAEAVLNGTEKALAFAHKRSAKGSEFPAYARTAGEMLMNLRQYSLAADLMEAGASGENAARVVALASALRKTKPIEELQFGKDPAGTLLRFFKMMMEDQNLTEEKVAAFSSRSAVKVLRLEDKQELEKTLKSAKDFRRIVAHKGGRSDVAMDLALQMVEPKLEGNDQIGYRAELRIPGMTNQQYFLVKEDGEYKILDSSEKPNAIGLEILDRIAADDTKGARALLDWVRDEQHLAGGDDPLAGAAFPRFWSKGKDADPRQMKLAAAAILVQTKPTAPQGIAILESEQKAANTDNERLNITLAIMAGYGILDQFEKQLAVASELARQYPESKRAFFAQTFDLRALGRFEESEKIARDKLERQPDDLDFERVLDWTATAHEGYAEAYEHASKVVASLKADGSDFNRVAWIALFVRKVTDRDIEYAVKGAQLSQNSAAILHTLGCLYAEVGKTKEAREVLIQAMDILQLDEPNSDYWYAFGRIAEQYGEREVAIADYARVEKPKRPISYYDSSYKLAETRMKMMGLALGGAAAKKN